MMTDAEPLSFPENPPAEATLPAPPRSLARRSLLKSYLDLGKARLSGMVVVTTALGYLVASNQNEALNFPRLAWTCLGTFLAAMGAGAFNQVIERRRDAKMNRTRGRPIPAGDLSPNHACFFALLASIVGIAILCPTSNGLTAVLGFATILLYVAIYTPMKMFTASNTLVGAIVGAIPPMMGWAAATGGLSAGAWVLGGILFVWQIPHFLALAWMYREDYARGGYKMISTVEPTGRLTAMLCILYSLALIPAAVAMSFLGYAGAGFAIVATLLGTGLVVLAARFGITHSQKNARLLFLATLLYLPLLSATLVIDARGKFDGMERTRAGYVQPSNDPFVDPGLAR